MSEGLHGFQIDDEFDEIVINALKEKGFWPDDKSAQKRSLWTIRHKQAVLGIAFELQKRIADPCKERIPCNLASVSMCNCGNSIPTSLHCHDLDKLILNSVPFMTHSNVHDLHRKYARHHMGKQVTMSDVVETVIDYESARFTKESKQLNAYETVRICYNDHMRMMEPVLTMFDLTSEMAVYDWTEWNTSEYCKNIRKLSAEYIINLLEAFRAQKILYYNGLSTIDDVLRMMDYAHAHILV